MSLYVAVGALVVVLVLRAWLGDRTMDLSSLTVLFRPVNRVRFALRRALAFSRGAPALPEESADGLFDYLELPAARAQAEARASELCERYDLERVRGHVARRALRENLYVLSLLDEHAAPHLAKIDGVATVIDVGSKDFVYAPALVAFASRTSKGAPSVTGVELDGHVVYKDLRSRADWAEAYARLAGPGARYHVGDFLAYESEEPAELVTVFYPFVTRFALLRWGLPAGEYKPEALLAHAVALLAPGGVLVVVNHTHEERELLRGLMRAIEGVSLVVAADVTSKLVDYYEDVSERSLSVYVKPRSG